jgi:thiosulfate reductase cytochrome b subunit
MARKCQHAILQTLYTPWSRILYLSSAVGLVPLVPLFGLPPSRCPRRWRYLVPGFGPRACSPRRYARATQRPRARYTSTHHSPPHVLASCASRRALSARASFSSRFAPIFTVFSLLRTRVPGSLPSFPHGKHTGHSPDTRRTLAVDNFRPPAIFRWPFGSHPLYNAPHSI